MILSKFHHLLSSLFIYFLKNRRPNLALVFFCVLCYSIFCYGRVFAFVVFISVQVGLSIFNFKKLFSHYSFVKPTGFFAMYSYGISSFGGEEI